MLYRVAAEIRGERHVRRILEAPYEAGAVVPSAPAHVYEAMRASLIAEGFSPAVLDRATYSLV